MVIVVLVANTLTAGPKVVIVVLVAGPNPPPPSIRSVLLSPLHPSLPSSLSLSAVRFISSKRSFSHLLLSFNQVLLHSIHITVEDTPILPRQDHFEKPPWIIFSLISVSVTCPKASSGGRMTGERTETTIYICLRPGERLLSTINVRFKTDNHAEKDHIRERFYSRRSLSLCACSVNIICHQQIHIWTCMQIRQSCCA